MGPVLDFPSVNGWGNVGGNWSQSVSAGAATFEAWIRTTAKASQTIVLGSSSPGATPRISVGGDQLSVYWNTSGSAPGWTSAQALRRLRRDCAAQLDPLSGAGQDVASEVPPFLQRLARFGRGHGPADHFLSC